MLEVLSETFRAVCEICGALFTTSLGLASHLRQKKDHQGHLPVNMVPSYADPQCDRSTYRTDAPDWGAPPSPQGGGSNFGMRTPSPGGGGSNFEMGDEEEEVDESSSPHPEVKVVHPNPVRRFDK